MLNKCSLLLLYFVRSMIIFHLNFDDQLHKLSRTCYIICRGPSTKWKWGAPCLIITKNVKWWQQSIKSNIGPFGGEGPCETAQITNPWSRLLNYYRNSKVLGGTHVQNKLILFVTFEKANEICFLKRKRETIYEEQTHLIK